MKKYYLGSYTEENATECISLIIASDEDTAWKLYMKKEKTDFENYYKNVDPNRLYDYNNINEFKEDYTLFEMKKETILKED